MSFSFCFFSFHVKFVLIPRFPQLLFGYSVHNAHFHGIPMHLLSECFIIHLHLYPNCSSVQSVTLDRTHSSWTSALFKLHFVHKTSVVGIFTFFHFFEISFFLFHFMCVFPTLFNYLFACHLLSIGIVNKPISVDWNVQQFTSVKLWLIDCTVWSRQIIKQSESRYF